MRIGDWSSDVCSSDLPDPGRSARTAQEPSEGVVLLCTRRTVGGARDSGPTGPKETRPRGDQPGMQEDHRRGGQLGREWRRERVCQDVSISEAAGTLHKTPYSHIKVEDHYTIT